MALKCKECDNEISDKAKSCPQCGAIVPIKKGFITNVSNGVLMTILVFLIFLIITSILTILTNPKTDGDRTLIFLFGFIISIFSPYLYKKYKSFDQNATTEDNELTQHNNPITLTSHLTVKVNNRQQENQEHKTFDYSNLMNKRVIIIYRDTNNNETQRTIDVKSISKEHINAFCHLRNGTRTFKKDRILSIFNSDSGESIDENVHTDIKEVKSKKRESKKYNSIDDILKYHQKEFEENNFFIDSKEDSISLCEYFKNGKKKSPFLSMEYNQYSTSYYYEPDELETEIEEESTRPWCIRGRELNTRTFKDFNKASRVFVEFAKKYKQ